MYLNQLAFVRVTCSHSETHRFQHLREILGNMVICTVRVLQHFVFQTKDLHAEAAEFRLELLMLG